MTLVEKKKDSIRQLSFFVKPMRHEDARGEEVAILTFSLERSPWMF